MKTTLTILAIVSAVAASLMIAPLLVPGAFAKINSVQTSPPSCTNGGGNEPGGQQPTCTGGGLTQNPGTTENQNPAGSAPPGQNK
jgi:hypothetical protein